MAPRLVPMVSVTLGELRLHAGSPTRAPSFRMRFHIHRPYRRPCRMSVFAPEAHFSGVGGNRAVATVTISAPDAVTPPTHAVMNSCNPTIEIVDIDFMNGGIISWVLDIIEGMLRNTMERLAEQTICTELQQILQGQTKDFLAFAKDTLDEYTNDNSVLTDEALLTREQQLEESLADEVRLLNLQDHQSAHCLQYLPLNCLMSHPCPHSLAQIRRRLDHQAHP